MNPEQLKEYKREKSKKFNANLRELRLKDKARQGNLQGSKQDDNQPDNQDDNQGNNNQPFKKVEPKTRQGNNQPDNQDDVLSLQDLMDIFETLDTKLEIIETKLVTKLENKLYELLDKLDIMENKLETIMENKLETKLETNQPIKQQPSIFFA
jgi:hypothetical protein